jgi:dihydrofolate synthase/folylpolyglutamate synthase
MTYQEALQYLRDLEPRGWRLGLERMQEFVRRAGLAPFMGEAGCPRYIHVAGTNGKGSVTAFVQSMLLSAGYRTGAFFSPYVVDPRERVWFGPRMISEQDFCEAIEKLKTVSESLEDTEFSGVTEFEMKTAVGFEHWRKHGAEWVALEVGLGGRFDATNVVTPRASVIVSIGLDHVQILGDTIEKIAFEKAGIIKPQVPVVIGEMPKPAREVIQRVAEEAASPVWTYGEEVCVNQVGVGEWRVQTPRSSAILRPGLYGEIQGHNSALAYAAMELSGAGSGQKVADAAQSASIPGRFQRLMFRDRQFVLDGAHNSEAALNLRRAVNSFLGKSGTGRVLMVSGMMSGHEPAGFFAPFADLVDEVHLATVDFNRAVPAAELKVAIGSLFPRVYTHESLPAAISSAVETSEASDLILVTGSFYLVGEALRLMNLS